MQALTLIPLGILIYLYFLSIKTRVIEEKKILWALPLLIVGMFVFYYLYCPFPAYVIPAVIIISCIGYVAMMKKA